MGSCANTKELEVRPVKQEQKCISQSPKKVEKVNRKDFLFQLGDFQDFPEWEGNNL